MSAGPDTSIEAVCRDTAALILDVPAGSLRDDSGPDDIAGWDSLNLVRIVLALESALEVRLSLSALEGLTSFGTLVSAFAAARKAATSRPPE